MRQAVFIERTERMIKSGFERALLKDLFMAKITIATASDSNIIEIAGLITLSILPGNNRFSILTEEHRRPVKKIEDTLPVLRYTLTIKKHANGYHKSHP